MESDRDTIVKLLRGVDWRLRARQGLFELSVGLSLVLAAGIAAALVRLLAPGRGPSLAAVVWLGLLVLVSVVGARAARHRPLSRAASVVDRHGDLKDLLRSAHEFIRDGVATPWIEFLIRRAAHAARALDPSRPVPWAMPRSLWVAAGLGLGLFIVGQMTPRSVARGATVLSEADEAAARRASELLRQAQDPSQTALEETLDELTEGQLTLGEGLLALDELRRALADQSLEMAGLRDTIGEAANELDGSPALDELAQALRDADLARAAELLRELRKKLPPPDSAAALDKLQQKLSELSAGDGRLEELLSRLEKAAEALRENDPAAESALEGAAETLEAMGEQFDQQAERTEASRMLDQLRASLRQKPTPSGLTPKSPSGSADPTNSAEEAVFALPGDQIVPQASDPGRPPDPEGPPTRLEVQLELERLGQEEQENPRPEEFFMEKTREQRSSIAYQPIHGGSRVQEEDAMHPDRIPWRHRKLVKQYFLLKRQGEGDAR